MITYKEVAKPVVSSVECDRCARVVDAEGDLMEALEFMHLSDTGGYASVFGDGSRIELDLCQHCVKEVLGQWIRVTQ